MKCIILAGGRGDRLWPLARQSYPKQFISIQGDHSLFQETIAGNIPYCDEFIIITNEEYRYIVMNQVAAFQGLVHRYIFEGEGRKTTAAITLACLRLEKSETVLVLPADQVVDGAVYKDDIMRAKELAKEGHIVTFGMKINSPEERYGYIKADGEDVIAFVEKPDRKTAVKYMNSGEYLVNSGMMVFRVGDYLDELKKYDPNIYSLCKKAIKMKETRGNAVSYSAEVLQTIPAEHIEKTLLEKTTRAKVINGHFEWKDVGCLEDIKNTNYTDFSGGREIVFNSDNTDIINRCDKSIVVANGIDDAVIVNTSDAVYVGKKGCSESLKEMIKGVSGENGVRSFFETGRKMYRSWGTYELLVDTPHYRVKHVVIRPGRTIYAHKHIFRSEHWTVVSGHAYIEIDSKEGYYNTDDVVDVLPGMIHQVTNCGDFDLVIVEVSVGENVSEDDKVSVEEVQPVKQVRAVSEPMVKLLPSYKDNLWGGNKLKKMFSKDCDFDILAESWELSAHEAGQSIVNSGRNKGKLFGEYLSLIGKSNWGWKCSTFSDFPILVKLIDARDKLSVQVHPDDEYAMENESQYGKNEVWYVVDCEPDSYLYCGFNREVSAEEVRERIENDTILEILNKIPVNKGDVYFIKTGTVHAIGAGIVICEIQQSSTCTYRLYDFNRRDKFGDLRELHIDKALDVMDFSSYCPPRIDEAFENAEGYSKRVISRCKYFECTLLDITDRARIMGVEESFTSLLCLEGSGEITVRHIDEPDIILETLKFKAGESMFAPKSTDIFCIAGECKLIMTRV
ncbi:MAG: NTP transferase domain-containing protein [Lachnospiraceae bacterium]|nr:NTP transferase domain-containing protein [Lachnospiraceae bacterium]